MKLNFRIERNYLIAHTISSWEQGRFSADLHRQELLQFINMAWDKHQLVYELLAGRLSDSSSILRDEKPFKTLVEAAKEVEAAISAIEASPEYQVIFGQARDYLSFCQSQWQDNLEQTEAFLRDLTGLDLEREFTVLITHPAQRNGQYLGLVKGEHTIGWGTTETWPNYTTVYLWHEILHAYLDVSPASHALIQLVADNELRCRLNGGVYPPLEGHGYLTREMELILPQWKKYLKTKDRRLLDLVASIKRTKNTLEV